MNEFSVLARVGLLVAEGGAGVVPEAWIDDLTTGGSTQQWADGDFAPWLPGGAYRSCWYQPRVDPGAVMGVGIGLAETLTNDLVLAAVDEATLARAARQIVEHVPGVTGVQVDVKDASEFAAQRAASTAANAACASARNGASAAANRVSEISFAMSPLFPSSPAAARYSCGT